MIETALNIVQRVYNRVGLSGSAPATLLSLTDPDVIQMLECLNVVLEELRQARAWTQQKRVHTFATVASQEFYQLPENFYSPTLRTMWNDSENVWIIPATDSHITGLKYGSNTSSFNYTVRIWGADTNPLNTGGGQFQLNPVPSSAQTIYFEYLTSDLFLPAYWVASTAYSLNDIVFHNGTNYICTSAGTSGTTGPSGTDTSGITDNTAEWGFDPTPRLEIVADTDKVIFDADLVRLGLYAYWLQEQKGEFEQPLMEFRRRIETAKSRYRGSEVYSMARRGYRPRYNVPSRNWGV